MQSYGAKSDLWSVGMVTYQLLTGRFPFCDNIRNCSLQDVWKAILTESGRMGRHLDKLEQVWSHYTPSVSSTCFICLRIKFTAGQVDGQVF